MSIIVNNTDGQLNINLNGVLDVYAVKSIKSVSRAVDATGNNYISINFIANDKNNSLRIPLSEVSSPAGWTNDTAGAIQAVEDIRDWLSEVINVNLDAADDQVGIYGYTNPADPNTFTGVKVDSSGVLAIQDNGSSITVDGTVALDTATLTALENITVQNGAGAAAVNIQDGGNSITTDTTQLPSTLGQTNMAGSVSVTLANNQLGVARTPGILRPTAAGNVNSVAATFYSVSVANVGAANGSVLGGASNIKPGEVLNFSADAVNNYFTTFAYDATGTEFIIIYVA